MNINIFYIITLLCNRKGSVVNHCLENLLLIGLKKQENEAPAMKIHGRTKKSIKYHRIQDRAWALQGSEKRLNSRSLKRVKTKEDDCEDN